MTEIVVRPVRFTADVAAMQSFLELIGLRPWIVTDQGGWSDMACGAGRVALHDAATSTSGAPSGQTTLSFEADDLAQLAEQLIAADVTGVTVYDEAYGRVLTCLDPDGAAIAVDERPTDLYGSQLRAEPGAIDSLRVMPVRFADPTGPQAGFLRALGLRPAGEINPYYVNFLAGAGAQGQVGLHHVFSGELPVVPGGDGALVQLTFESAEPLDQIAARLSAAGYDPRIITEDFGSLLSVVDPDGQEVQVHAAAASIAGFEAGYVNVAGLLTWREVRGEGPAVVLLHGGFFGAASWAAQAPTLVSAGFRVHVPERRGHAHTRDVDGPLTYAVMAADTLAYLDSEVGQQAHLVGWSDGAVVALLVALQRPDLVGRMVLIGQYYNSSGRVPGSDLDRLLRSDAAKDFLRRGYDPVSPDGPEHFEVIYAKTMAMIDSEPEIDLATLTAVAAPTLVLQGDRDEVTLEHGAAVADALGDGRLAVLPGTHGLPIEVPELINALLISFLRGAVPGPALV